MKIVQLNSFCGKGSTGTIALNISHALGDERIENYILYTLGDYKFPLGIKYSCRLYIKLNALLSKIFGNYGFNSNMATRRLIKHLERIKPDIVHIHNIHSHDVNLRMLFKYLNKNNIRVVMTLHDCWMFTGYCTHFDVQNCDKWQSCCENCPQAKRYSRIWDKSARLFEEKKKLITSMNDLTVVAPSNYLAKLAKKSFLNKFPIEVINNGVDLDVFKKTDSDFKDKYNLNGKKIVFGIPKSKIDLFIKLNELLDKEKYRLVLAGLTQKELHSLSDDILGLPYMMPSELAKVFSAADVFVNMTLEDTFPTVNLESLACGTPVITFDTGGSPEAVDENTGRVVVKNDLNATIEAVSELCASNMSDECIARAKKFYNAKERYSDYVKLYKREGRF